MQINDYIDPVDLLKNIDEGYVMMKDHPSLPLRILSYTRKTVYDQHWNDVTVRTRGLIYNRHDGSVIARPFEKFFDAEAHSSPLFEYCYPNPIIADKLDGSLGIFWEYEGHWGIASKGFFKSRHSEWMTRWMAQHIEKHGPSVWPVGYTPVFEMIAESVQTHIINYGGDENLVLLALVKIETGEELDSVELEDYAQRNFLTTPALYNMTLWAAMALDRGNHEGFVVTYPRVGKPPLKLKVKHKTFLKHQKLVNGVSPANLLKLLSNEQTEECEYLYKALPAHVSTHMADWEQKYRSEYKHILAHTTVLVHDILKDLTTRKEAAEFLLQTKNRPYASICFSMLDHDERGYKTAIWKLVGERIHIDNTIDGGE
jgi:RNA ligase